MTYMLRSFISLMALSLFFLAGPQAKASHYSSGEIFYRWSPTPSDSLRYEVCVYFYRNNNGAQIPNQPINICVSSSCFADVTALITKDLPPPGMASPGDPNGGWIVPGLDECADASDPDYKDLSAHIWCGYVTLPGTCGDFEFKAAAPCCRDLSDNLLGSSGRNMMLSAALNNTLGENSSPEIQAPAGKAFCLSQAGARPFEFIQAAIDADGDSIVYRFGNPQESSGPANSFTAAYCGSATNIPFAPGYTVNNPFPSSTGIIIDQQNGIFRFSPSQQGSYVVKIIVEDWRLDPLHLIWVNIGTTIREIQIPVTANCNPNSSGGPRLALGSSSNNASIQNYTQAQIDSMMALYNMLRFAGNDSSGSGANLLHQIPVFQGYQCFDSIVSIEFNNNVRCSSVDPTDFRLIGPDGISRPIIAAETNCQFLVTRHVNLRLEKPLDVDGNYVLQIRRGNDGNSLTNECGIELPEFYTFLIPVSGCPKPIYNLDGLTVQRDVFVRIDWSGNNDLQNPAILQNFDAWNIYRSEKNQSAFSLIKVIKDPNARFFVDSMDRNGFYVDHHEYDYQVQLVYNGKGRSTSRACRNILLRIDESQKTEAELPLFWNHFECIDASLRNYDVFVGKRDSSLADPGIRKWERINQTTDTTAIINLPSSSAENQGTYVSRVVARNINGSSRVDSSESNWIYYFINHYPPQEPEPDLKPGAVLIPNIITPNGDGVNDRFFIATPENGVQFEQISLSIYNRHGEEVFRDAAFHQSNSRENGWGGLNQAGQKLSSGVYFYVIHLQNPSTNESQTLNGSLTLNSTK